MSEQEVKLKVTADTGSAEQGFDKLKRKQEEVGDSAEKVSASYEALVGFAKSAGAALGAAFSINAAKDLLEFGAQLDDVSSGFNRLSAAAGESGDALLQKLRRATGDTIPDIELMTEATQALRAGLKPDEMVTVTEAARALAEETGGNAKEALDGLIFSLQSGNDRFLKTQGIIIDNKKAFEEYAAANGLVADKLDEVQKAEALRAASIEALKQKISDVGPITADVGDKFAMLSTTLSNAYGKFALAAAGNAAVNDALDGLNVAIKNIDFTAILNGLGGMIGLLKDSAIAAADATEKVIDFAAGVLRGTGEAIGNAATAVKNAVQSMTPDVENFGRNLRGVNELLRSDSKEATQAAVIAYSQLAQEALKNSAVAGNMGSAMAFTGEQVRAAAQKFGVSTDALKALTTQAHEATGATSNHNAVVSALVATQKKLQDGVKNATNEINKATKTTNAATKDAKTYDSVIASIVTDLEKQKKALQAINGNGGLEEFKRQVESITDAYTSNQISSDEATARLNTLAQSFKDVGVDAEGFATALDEAGKKISTGIKKTADDVDAQVSQIKDSIGQELLGSLSNILADGLVNGFDGQSAQQAAGAIGSAIGAALGTAIGAYLGSPATGALLGGAIGGALGQLSVGLFGKDSAGTKFRKSVDKFFADAFDADRLMVVINGQLKQIKDLDFSGKQFGDPAAGFFDAFNKLPATAQAAFSGVATAYAEALGQGQEFAANLAAVFVNNIGGSLNNLQLLVQASGMSFEQLHDSVVNAFLDGKLSAIEALSALQQINNISQKGIPDGVGMIVTAFENLKAAGEKGGRAATDALRDLADEAKELHVKTLPELMQRLVQSGKFSAQEIKILFDALAKNGITSIEQLSKATDEQLIAILAELQAQKFPFAQGTQDAKDLLAQVEKLPEKIKTKLVFEVQTVMDENTRQAQAAGVFDKAAVQFREIGQREGIR